MNSRPMAAIHSGCLEVARNVVGSGERERQNCEDTEEEDIEEDLLVSLRQSYAELEVGVRRSLSQSF